MSTEAFDFSVEHFFGFLVFCLCVYFLFCFVVLAEKDLLQGQAKRQADSCPKKFRAPQRFSQSILKNQVRVGRVAGYVIVHNCAQFFDWLMMRAQGGVTRVNFTGLRLQKSLGF